ncbi:MAG: addiction module antitoxin RelB [Candidatus Doudnabacteria bacterium RIFCSPHIGHO2_02_FULL_49_24]|nr:MAG: addiction module antitoxin RelB [Candidatus Doudnabacteria bacterium RIFCSPHIGHO2_02_FULL_49_24]
MNFKIVYHPLVVRDDIPKLSIEWKIKIQKTIEARLTTHPETYGKPLRRSLKGYRKLRIGDYRVIFLLEKNTVKILVVQHRSVVYDRINKRI